METLAQHPLILKCISWTSLSTIGIGFQYCSRDCGSDLSAVQPNVDEHAVIALANVANPNAEIGDLVEYVYVRWWIVGLIGKQHKHCDQQSGLGAPCFRLLSRIVTLASDCGHTLKGIQSRTSVFSPFQRFGLSGFSEAKVDRGISIGVRLFPLKRRFYSNLKMVCRCWLSIQLEKERFVCSWEFGHRK